MASLNNNVMSVLGAASESRKDVGQEGIAKAGGHPRLPPSAIRKAVSNVRRKGVLGQKKALSWVKNETPFLGELTKKNRDLVEL